MKAAKRRLDQLLVERGLAANPTRARALVMAGKVFSGDRRLDKPGQALAAGSALEVRGPAHPWVSRGGVKLAHGLDCFAIDPAGLVCLDIGAATGGFTDVLLHRGAARVHAVDVGHGQLAWKLRQDARVTVRERTNARHLDASQIPEPVDLLVCDASFISLRTLLPAPLRLVAPGGRLLVLIKPQFEAGRDQVGKGGVVRDPAVRAAVCDGLAAWLNEQPGWQCQGIEPSPILGPEGNAEFLMAGRLAAAAPQPAGDRA